MNAIAHRYWNQNCPVFYVSNLPGGDGSDWGYVTRAEQALPLSPYWQRRFAADCRRAGVIAHFIPCTN